MYFNRTVFWDIHNLRISLNHKNDVRAYGCHFTIYSLFLDIHNSLKDIHNLFMDILYSFMDILK